MAFLGGTYYFGESQSLVNLSACAAFLTGNTLSADTYFILVGNSIDNSMVTFTSISMSAYNISFASQNEVCRFNQNYCINTHAGTNIFFSGLTGYATTRIIDFNKIHFRTNHLFSDAFNCGGVHLKFRNCCFSNWGSYASNYLFSNPIVNIFTIYNCKVYMTAQAAQIYTTVSANIENLTYYTRYGAQLNINSNARVKNCLFYQVINNTAQVPNSTYISASYVNFSSLGEFNGNVSGYDFTGVFVSTVSSDDNFLDLAGKSVTSAGLIPDVPSNITGIRGNRRPGRDGLYSIGADEYGSDASYVSFESTTYHSPSPAYLRLVDTSDIRDYTDSTDYTRIWKTVNDRTSATTYYTTSASYLDFSVSGVYGDTISISLSAVF